jgi:hypothetical protein
MEKKITTIEQLGEELRTGFSTIRHDVASVASDLKRLAHDSTENFKSIGDHFGTIEDRLDELADLQRLTLQVERIRQHLRERDHVEL